MADSLPVLVSKRCTSCGDIFREDEAAKFETCPDCRHPVTCNYGGCGRWQGVKTTKELEAV